MLYPLSLKGKGTHHRVGGRGDGGGIANEKS